MGRPAWWRARYRLMTSDPKWLSGQRLAVWNRVQAWKHPRRQLGADAAVRRERPLLTHEKESTK
jgi:hypothetical protein